MSGDVFITNDAALHRAFRKADPYVLHPVDWELLEGKADVITVEAMAERGVERLEKMEHPPMLPPNSGDVVLTPEKLRELARGVPEGYAIVRDSIVPTMGTALTALVYELRVVEGLSYRALAQWMHEAGLIVVSPALPSNQLVGMAIVDVAAQQRGEDYHEPPWNAYP